MENFKDTTGREYTIAIDYAAIQRVADAANDFDLMSLIDPRVSAAVDPLKLILILYHICKPQAAGTYEQFRDALDPDTLEQAAKSLEGALIEFAPTRLRPMLQKISENAGAMRDAVLIAADRLLNATSPAQILSAIRNNQTAGGPVASTASVPTE